MSNGSQTTQARSSQFRNLIIFSIVVMIIFGIFVWVLSGQKNNNEKIEKTNFSNPLDHADSETIVLERVQKSVEESQKQTEILKKQFDEKINSKNIGDENKQNDLEKRLKILESKLTDNKNNAEDPMDNSSLMLSGSQNYQGRVLPSPTSRAQQYDRRIAEDTSIREDRLSLSPNEDELKKIRPLKNPETYVPSGTFAAGVVLEGADASTAVTAQSNPEPMIIRITDEGSLPNGRHSHLKGCRVTAAASGDISSERGKIRIEKMSCVTPNDEIIDIAVEGNIAGSDGKNGVRGNLREGGGQYAARAFGAGFLQGVSEGFAQNYTINSVSPQGNVETVNSGKIFQYGGAKGTSKAMDKLADYNIKRAEQFQPVVQLSAGSEVTVSFINGFYLDGKKHDAEEKEENHMPILFEANSKQEANSHFPNESTLPLSSEQVKLLQQRSKELGLRVSDSSSQ
jgi:conjugal transfer pilus assembly protein TraB